MRTQFDITDLWVFLPLTITCVFIVAKLTQYIDWHWLIVLSPILLPLCIGVCLYIAAIIVLKFYENEKDNQK